MTATLAIALLRADGVVKSFGDEPAVAGIDLDLVAGEIHALVGLNGAGKTTLMRLLLGMVRPDAGRVTLSIEGNPVDVGRVPPPAWRAVGHLVETPFAYAELTVSETVRAAARLHGMSAPDAMAAAEQVIDDLALRHWARRRNRVTPPPVQMAALRAECGGPDPAIRARRRVLSALVRAARGQPYRSGIRSSSSTNGSRA